MSRIGCDKCDQLSFFLVIKFQHRVTRKQSDVDMQSREVVALLNPSTAGDDDCRQTQRVPWQLDQKEYTR